MKLTDTFSHKDRAGCLTITGFFFRINFLLAGLSNENCLTIYSALASRLASKSCWLEFLPASPLRGPESSGWKISEQPFEHEQTFGLLRFCQSASEIVKLLTSTAIGLVKLLTIFQPGLYSVKAVKLYCCKILTLYHAKARSKAGLPAGSVWILRAGAIC